MVGYIQDTSGIWRLKNFGKAFVSPHANLDLASSFEMQSKDLGTVFELNGTAWLIDEDGVYYPLFRKDGLWQFNIRFPASDGTAENTAYQAACESEIGPVQSSVPPSSGDPVEGNFQKPSTETGSKIDFEVSGAFAFHRCPQSCCQHPPKSGSLSESCCDPSNLFEHMSCGGCESCVDEVFISGGAPGEFLIEGIELALPSNFVLKKDDLAKVMQKIANMKKYHIIYKHANVDRLNKLIDDGVITDGIKLQSISCKVCELSRAQKAKVSKKASKSYPMKPFHIVQGDIFEVEEAASRNNFKYILAFIDVVS